MANREPGLWEIADGSSCRVTSKTIYLPIPPCSCGADEHNHWDHEAKCLWKGCSYDPPYNNALKLRLQDVAQREATGENWMPIEVGEL